MSTTFSNSARGDGGQVTIGEANVIQPLSVTTRQVKWVIVAPDKDNSGNLQVSYDATPLLPSLSLSSEPGRFYDLNRVNIRGDTAGDKANWNAGTSFP